MWSRSLDLTWKSVQNAASQVLPQTYWIRICSFSGCLDDLSAHSSLRSPALEQWCSAMVARECAFRVLNCYLNPITKMESLVDEFGTGPPPTFFQLLGSQEPSPGFLCLRNKCRPAGAGTCPSLPIPPTSLAPQGGVQMHNQNMGWGLQKWEGKGRHGFRFRPGEPAVWWNASLRAAEFISLKFHCAQNHLFPHCFY